MLSLDVRFQGVSSGSGVVTLVTWMPGTVRQLMFVLLMLFHFARQLAGEVATVTEQFFSSMFYFYMFEKSYFNVRLVWTLITFVPFCALFKFRAGNQVGMELLVVKLQHAARVGDIFTVGTGTGYNAMLDLFVSVQLLA